MMTVRAAQQVSDEKANLSKGTVLIRLENHSFGNTRKLKDSQYEVEGGDKSMTRASRQLLDSPELKEVNRLMAEAWRFVDAQSLPFPVSGVHMLPIKKVEDVIFTLDEFSKKIDEAVELFCDKYVDRQQEAKQRNPKLYNPADYKPRATVRREFSFFYQLITIDAPAGQLDGLDPEILKMARQNTERLWADAAQMTRDMQSEIMLTLVKKLKDKLEDEEPGKVKKFKNSTVDNLTEFLRDFERSMNVTNFSELGKLVEQGRKLLSGVAADDLRDSVTLRAKVRADLAVIETKLQPLVGERKVRAQEE